MKCKICGTDNPELRKTCCECGRFLEGNTINNVTGEYGYRGSNGLFYKNKSEFDYSKTKKLC